MTKDDTKAILADPDTSHTTSSAAKVFGIWELCGSIIIHIEAKDIPAISMVNRTCYNICRTDKVLKFFLCSDFFFYKCGKLEPSLKSGAISIYIQDALNGNALVMRAGLSKGLSRWVNILKLHNREVIVLEIALPHKSYRLEVLLTEDEEIPALEAGDRDLLKCGWHDAIKQCARSRDDNGFLMRLGRGVMARADALVSSEVVA